MALQLLQPQKLAIPPSCYYWWQEIKMYISEKTSGGKTLIPSTKEISTLVTVILRKIVCVCVCVCMRIHTHSDIILLSYMPCAYNSWIVSPLSYWNLQFHYWWQLRHLLVRYHSENTEHTTHITLQATKAERMLWASLLCSEVFLVDQLSIQNEFRGFWGMSQPPSERMDCMRVICTLDTKRVTGEGKLLLWRWQHICLAYSHFHLFLHLNIWPARSFTKIKRRKTKSLHGCVHPRQSSMTSEYYDSYPV